MPDNIVTALAAAVPSVPGLKDIQVAPDKLLDAAKVIQDQADALQKQIEVRLGQLQLNPPSDDIVSTHAFDAWNEVVAMGEGSYAQRVTDYIKGLRTLANQLRAAAQEYNLGEEDKAAAFRDRPHVGQA